MADGRTITIGPCQTEHGPRCTSDTHRCRHYGIHDHHYTYCSAQDAPNLSAHAGQYAYPWAGAGRQFSGYPADGCPLIGTTSATKEP